MGGDPGFSEFVRGRAKERREAEVRALGEAVSLASRNEQFLRRQIAENLTSPNTPALAALLGEYKNALRTPDLSILSDLNDRLDQLVTKEGLTQAYEAQWQRKQRSNKPARRSRVKRRMGASDR